MSNQSARRWGPKLLADARQGIVGGGAFALVTVLVVALLGVIGGTVPAWTLGLPLLLLFPAAAVITGLQRRLDAMAGELREARRQATEARKAEVHFRQQLDQAAIRNGPLDPTTQGFLGRIHALRESLPGPETHRINANRAEIGVVQGVIEDMREEIGDSRALTGAENLWCRDGTGQTLENLRLTLRQLEAVAQAFGLERIEARAEARRPQGSAF